MARKTDTPIPPKQPSKSGEYARLYRAYRDAKAALGKRPSAAAKRKVEQIHTDMLRVHREYREDLRQRRRAAQPTPVGAMAAEFTGSAIAASATGPAPASHPGELALMIVQALAALPPERRQQVMALANKLK